MGNTGTGQVAAIQLSTLRSLPHAVCFIMSDQLIGTMLLSKEKLGLILFLPVKYLVSGGFRPHFSCSLHTASVQNNTFFLRGLDDGPNNATEENKVSATITVSVRGASSRPIGRETIAVIAQEFVKSEYSTQEIPMNLLRGRYCPKFRSGHS